ncbi:alpha/beta hydrolase [Actinoplanes sp. NPDC049596]|uniref:alpha/beta hydrolase n=1 Tax=unclassified Actinoplanes TaxID=2626549 RepID=UPI003424FD8F
MADAVVIPGGRYGPVAGMLAYAGTVPEKRGATAHAHEWSTTPPAHQTPEIEAWVRDQITPVLDALPGPALLIGKSLGSNAACVAADRGLPAVWLTPLLHLPWVVAALHRATAPCLLVGGTADQSWDSATAHRLSPYVLEVPTADHGMFVPGPLTDSIAVLARIVVAVEDFLDEIQWP